MNLTKAFVYILSNKNRTTFYIGVTNDLERRIKEHKQSVNKGFTSRYNLFDLLYYETIGDIETAILREKQLKRWHREWKLNLIKEMNPEMKDLAFDWE